MAKNDSPLEDWECQMFHRWLSSMGIPHEHVPNESRSSKKDAYIRGAKLKGMGVSKGFWDYIVFVPYKGVDGTIDAYQPVLVEMKRQKGSRTSKEQEAWREIYQASGLPCEVCHGYQEAKAYIESFIKEDEDRCPF